MARHNRKGDVAVLDLHYLISTPHGVQYVQEKQELGLFETEQLLEMLERNGVQATALDGFHPLRHLIVGVRLPRLE
jgi:hypothetical protein